MSDMWFGNRNYMTWVPCPAVGADYGREAGVRSLRLLNGGRYQKTTKAGAKTYSLTWNRTTRDALRPITDFAEGVYGDGAIHWTDPFAMDKNVLAQSFATPSLGGYDGVILNGADSRPELVPTSANTLGYPTESAIYTMAGDANSLKHWVPIPPGYTAWVGAHGVAGSGGVVQVKPTTGPSTYGATVNLTLLSVASTTRFNASFARSSGITGIELSLGGTGTITLSGIMVQVLPDGSTPESGGYISGQGHSGCVFDGHPSIEAYSVVFDRVGMSANFVETEQWR
jgi:hypothetical protein